MANEPTAKQGRQIVSLIEDYSRERVQAALNSGLLSVFFSANFAKIDEVEFSKVCGVVVPYPGEIFPLKIGKDVRKFKLLLYIFFRNAL